MTLEQSLELHLSKKCRKDYLLDNLSFSETGKLLIEDSYQIHEITESINQSKRAFSDFKNFYKSSDLNALALIEKINHFIIKNYLMEADNLAFKSILTNLNENYGKDEVDKIFKEYNQIFSERTEDSLNDNIGAIPRRELFLEEIILLKICNNNKAAGKYKEIFDDTSLVETTKYTPVFYTIMEQFDSKPSFGPGAGNLIKLLMEPSQKHPDSLEAQIEYMRENWSVLTDKFLLMLMRSLDMIKEENKAFFNGPGPTNVIQYHKYEEDDSPNFSPDSNWMPEVILLAKNSLVWLDQLSRDYKKRDQNSQPDTR